MADQYNNYVHNQQSNQNQQANTPTQQDIAIQNQQNINQTDPNPNNRDQPDTEQVPLTGTIDEQGHFGDQGSLDRYTYQGPKPEDAYLNDNTAPDGYGDQDQFADVDGQDPYSNLNDDDPGSTPGGEGLYGLEEPLAQPGEQSLKGRDKDLYGTRGSQDQYGYQK